MGGFLKSTIFLIMTLIISGCANWNGIYRSKSITSQKYPEIMTVDAKQRMVLMVPEVYNKAQEGMPPDWTATGNWRVCAEASPDVFSALAASASGSLKADLMGKSGELGAALAVTESAASIERTQTINLLRESFYRTCERYLSGSITKSAFVVQAGRDWKAMIAILAIEQLTRAARPAPTVLVTGGTSASVAQPQDWVRAIETAQADVRAADESVKLVTDASKSTREAKCDSGDAAAIAECKAKKGEAEKQLSDATARASEARVRLDAILVGAKNGGVDSLSKASTSAVSLSSKALTEGERSSSDLSAVSKHVRDITIAALETDEIQLFCIQMFANTEINRDMTSAKSALDGACLDLLAESARVDADKLRMTRAHFFSESDRLFDIFWNSLKKNDGSLDSVALEERVDGVFNGRSLIERLYNAVQKLRSAKDRAEAYEAFNILSAADRQDLAKK